MVKIEQPLYDKMPNDIKAMFNILPNSGKDEVVAMFPINGGAAAPVKRGMDGKSNGIYGDFSQKGDDGESFYGDKGSAARFFYCAKVSPSERNMGCGGIEPKHKDDEYRNRTGDPFVDMMHGFTTPQKNNHPTVKPLALMRYLVRLVTQPNGLVYDPFSGSGSTLISCKQEGFNFIGSELQEEYIQIATARISAATPENKQLTLL